MSQGLIKEKNLIMAARVLSIIFNPFYLPLVGLVLLFWCSYLSMLNESYKWLILLTTYLFTILIPTYLIRVYNTYQGKRLFKLGPRERRMVPYIISIISYFTCYYLLAYFHIPHFINLILVAALAIQVTCAIINVWWNISTHSAGIGGVTGALVVFSVVFGFYLLWWLSLTLIIAGLVGSSRLILRRHTLAQVVVGYLLGLVITALIIIFI